jgi:hypothetical protein
MIYYIDRRQIKEVAKKENKKRMRAKRFFLEILMTEEGTLSLVARTSCY